MTNQNCNGFSNKPTFDYAMYLTESGEWNELVNYNKFNDNSSLSDYLMELATEMVGLDSTKGYSLHDSLLTTVLAEIDYYQIAERILDDVICEQSYLEAKNEIQ